MHRVPAKASRRMAAAALAVLTAAIVTLLATASPGNSAGPIVDALRKASPGDVISMPGGDYGALELDSDFAWDGAPVTLRSADPADPIVLRAMLLKGVRNLIVEGVTFDYVPRSGDSEKIAPFSVRSSVNVTVRGGVFDGADAVDGKEWARGFGFGHGFYVYGGKDIALEGSTFFNWKRAGVFERVTGLTVRGNEVRAIRSDGFDFAQVQDVLIEANHLHDFEGAPEGTDHRDMIQFWTASTDKPSRNVTIRGNVLDSGNGSATQSIFIRNEISERDETRRDAMLYRDFTIENNLIRNGHVHGITVTGIRGLTVRNNTVIQDGDAGLATIAAKPAINLRWLVHDAVLTDNVSSGIAISDYAAENGLTESGNVIVQRGSPAVPLYYDALFLDGLGDGAAAGWDDPLPDGRLHGLPPSAVPALRGLQLRPDGALAGAAAGAALQRDPALPAVAVIAETPAGLSGQSRRTLRLQAWTAQGAPRDLSGARVLWRLGDGTEQETDGPTLTHRFAAPGDYRAVVSATLPDGGTLRAGRSLRVRSPVGLAEDFTTMTEAPPGLSAPAVLRPGEGVVLRGGDASGTVSFGRQPRLSNLEAFTLSATFRMTDPSQAGTLVYIGGALVVDVSAREAGARIWLGKGRKLQIRAPAALADGRPHTVTVSFSSETGLVRLWIDGAAIRPQSGAKGGIFTGPRRHAFYLGHPRKRSFGGVVERIQAFPVAAAPEDIAALTD